MSNNRFGGDPSRPAPGNEPNTSEDGAAVPPRHGGRDEAAGGARVVVTARMDGDMTPRDQADWQLFTMARSIAWRVAQRLQQHRLEQFDILNNVEVFGAAATGWEEGWVLGLKHRARHGRRRPAATTATR